MNGLSRIAALIGLWLVLTPAPALAEAEAVARLAEGLAAAELRDGKASPDLLPVLEELAQAQSRDGDLGAAVETRRRALDIAVRAFGCDSPHAAEAMTALALADIDRRHYLDAEPLLIIAESVLKEHGGGDLPAMATIRAGLARIALAHGESEPATAWAEQAVATAHRNPDRRSTEPLRALGAALTAQQRFEEAERVSREALAQDREQHGSDAAETARSLAQLAKLHLRQGRAADALPLIQEAAAIDQARLGPTHPFIADDLHDLGLAYDALHRTEAARNAFQAAVSVLQRGAGRDTPRVAYAEIELSRIYRQLGDEQGADSAFADARRILNKAEAEEHRRERRV